jgi:hypothetical protein
MAPNRTYPPSNRTQHERLVRTLGLHPPVLSGNRKRIIIAAYFAIPAAIAAMAISDATLLPNSLRCIISPGLWVGRHFVRSQVCWGFTDCLAQFGSALSRSMTTELCVNALVYGAAIFGVETLFRRVR